MDAPDMLASRLCVLILTLLLICPYSVEAAEVIETCHSIEDSTDRLQCYDRASGKPEAVDVETEIQAEENLQNTGKHWRYSDEKSSLDGRLDVWLSVRSNNSQPNQIGSPEKATLHVRCMNNSTNLLISFNDYTSDNQSVKYKLDSGGVAKIWMQTMNGGDGIGLWSGRSAIPFVKKLFGKETLILAYRSYSNHNLEFTFDISGLKDRIEPLASSCQWKP
jgi:type VI secretion system protein VasI